MENLKVGVGSAVITPPVGYYMASWALRKGRSTGVHDHHYAKSLVLDDGENMLAIASLDVVNCPEELTLEIRKIVQDRTGIPGENVMISCTHTHTGPILGGAREIERGRDVRGFEKYIEIFPDYVAGSIIEGYNRLVEATIGASSSHVPGVSCNRRYHEKPVDTELGVLKVEKKNGKPLASVINFAAHELVVDGRYLFWTADYPGYAKRLLEKVWPGSTSLFLAGAGGNVSPWDMWRGNENCRPSTYEEAERLGNILASEAFKTMQTIKTSSEVNLKVISETVDLPCRKLPWSISEAEEVLEEVLNMKDPGPTWDESNGPAAPEDCGGTANQGIRYCGTYRPNAIKGIIRLIKGSYTEEKVIPTELQVFKIGDIVLAANPGELFNELGLKIKEQSPYENTFVVSYANGTIGYIPTREAVEEASKLSLRDIAGVDSPLVARKLYGGIPASTRMSELAGDLLVDKTLKLIKKLQ